MSKSNAVVLFWNCTTLTADWEILSRTTLGYVWDVILLNNRPKNEEPSEILTWLINSWVAGSWYADVAVIWDTTPDEAPII